MEKMEYFNGVYGAPALSLISGIAYSSEPAVPTVFAWRKSACRSESGASACARTYFEEKTMKESVCKCLRRLINAPEILALPGVFDGFSTRLVQRAGYKAAFITGSGVSEARLGQPDVGLMGLEENVAAARAMTACSDLALLADGDTGYGNAVNVYHTVRAFERAGVAGVMLEDQVWPKRCGHMKGKEVISAEEMVEKIRAAASSRSDQ